MKRSRKIWLSLGFLALVALATMAATPKPRLKASLSFLRNSRAVASTRTLFAPAPDPFGTASREAVREEDTYLISDDLSDVKRKIANELPAATMSPSMCAIGAMTMADYDVPSSNPDENITITVVQDAPKVSRVIVSVIRDTGAVDKFRNWLDGFLPSKSPEKSDAERWAEILAAEKAMQE